jgi:uronate dehydrogenase
MPRLKVLLTGSGGRIGRHLVGPFKEVYDLRTLDRRPAPADPDAIIADLVDFPAMKKAMKGIDVVVHLAATPDEAPFVEQLVPNNVVGLYNTFQAACEAKVRRIVFASTCQTVLARPWPWEGTIRIADPPRPCTTYGATKVFGEALGRFYHHCRKMQFVGIRIGAFAPYDSASLRTSDGTRALWLSPRDAVALFRRAIEKPDVGYALVFGTSVTEREFLSRQEGKDLLDYEPQDDVVKLYGPMTPRPKAK